MHWACRAYAALELIDMIDESGMKKKRLHVKKMRYPDMNYDTYFIRPTNGHSSPGIKCPESLFMKIIDLSAPGHFVISFMELNGRIYRVFS
eukprot:8249901-Pyramimonas_sp.AAC.1